MPLLLPLLPDVMPIQPALLVAIQEQPLVALTLTLPVPPLATKDLLVDEIKDAHDAPDWLKVTVLPAMVIVPVLELVLLLAATE